MLRYRNRHREGGGDTRYMVQLKKPCQNYATIKKRIERRIWLKGIECRIKELDREIERYKEMRERREKRGS